MGRWGLGGLVVLSTTLSAAAAQTPPPAAAGTRVEVPIREVVLSNQTRRYSIPIMVGGTRIEAGLDSGSSGLRILPNVLAPADVAENRAADVYGFGAGAQLRGVTGTGILNIGGLAAPSTMQLVKVVACTEAKPDCSAAKLKIAQYGVQGDGLPGEGFKAIIGVNMADAEVASPLRAIGAKRWIIELPLPNGAAPGRLILNPTDDEVKDYARAPIQSQFSGDQGGFHDAVQGCLLNMANKAKACAPTALDTGAPGIQAVNTSLNQRSWAPGARSTLAFYDQKGKVTAVAQFNSGERNHASNLTIRDEPHMKGARIFSGLTGYFAFSVLYDPAAKELGFKPRPAPPAGMTAAARKPGDPAL